MNPDLPLCCMILLKTPKIVVSNYYLLIQIHYPIQLLPDGANPFMIILNDILVLESAVTTMFAIIQIVVEPESVRIRPNPSFNQIVATSLAFIHFVY